MSEWISVKDRLPENEVEVQVCCVKKFRGEPIYVITSGIYEDGTMLEERSRCTWENCDFEYSEKDGDYIIPKSWWEDRHYNDGDVYNNFINDEVIAWMPLPEPYKESEEE